MIIDFSLGYFWCPLSKSVPYALRVVGVAALYINYELLFRSFRSVFSKTKQCKYPMPVDFPRCGNVRLVLLRGIASLTIMSRRLLHLANTAKCGDHNYAFR